MNGNEFRMRDIKSIMILHLIAILATRQYTYVSGLSCYVCQSQSRPSLSLCVSNPVNFSSSCDLKYCTILRKELSDPKGILTTFYRGCEKNPKYLNTVVETPSATTYYRACSSDLCNTGDGMEEVSTNTILEIVGTSIVVPGLTSRVSENGAINLHAGTISAFLLIIVVFLLVAYFE